jgi:hypothetical protein
MTDSELPEEPGGADLWAAALPGQIMLPAQREDLHVLGPIAHRQ